VPDLGHQTRDVVATAIAELERAQASPTTGRFAKTVVRRLKGLRSYDDAITAIDRLSKEVGQIHAILHTSVAALRQAETSAAGHLAPTDEAWWRLWDNAVRRELADGRIHEGLQLWSATWVDGLAAGAWDGCRRLLGLPGLPAAALPAAEAMGEVTEALARDETAAALEPLETLLFPEDPSTRLPFRPSDEVRLAVLRARVLLHGFADRVAPREAADAAVRVAGDDAALKALAVAVRAEAALAAGDVGGARAALLEVDDTAAPTDVLVVQGLLFERDGMWTIADEYYDRAVRSATTAVSPELLRPVPARLLVRAARVSPSAEESVRLLEIALDQGVPGEGDHPDREVRLLHAEKLLAVANDADRSDDPEQAASTRTDAAASLMTAGQQYSAEGLTLRAVELFERASALAPAVPEYHWTCAEAQRLLAHAPDGSVDRSLLRAGREHLDAGLRVRPPRPDEAWVLITQAMLEDLLPDARHDPATLAERALLLEPDYTLGYAFLAVILRGQGWQAAALAAATQGRDTTALEDPFRFSTHLELLLDHERYDEADRLLDWRSIWEPGGDLPVQRARLLLSRGRPDEALTALADADPTDYVRMVRGHALFAVGDHQGSRDEFWSLWNDTRSGPAATMAGWAAYRAGRVDDGIAIYRSLAEDADPRTPVVRDLGQMLLVRGDVDAGRALLERGIAACPYPAELLDLDAVELDYARKVTATTGHAREAAEAIEHLSRRARDRVQELRGRVRDPEGVAARLASARTALAAGRAVDAVSHYADLVGSAEVPEATTGLLRAAHAARHDADRRFVEGDHDEARRQWSAVETALARVPADADDMGVRSALTCRQTVAGLIDGRADAAAHVIASAGDADVLAELDEAARTLAADPGRLWSLRDALLAVRDDRGRPGLVESLVSRLPIGEAYQLAAADADTHGTNFVTVNPLELRLGPGYDDLVDSASMAEACAEFRARIEDWSGVRIPWLHADSAPDLDDGIVEVRVYGRWVGEAPLDTETRLAPDELLRAVEGIVRRHLYRLVGVDDIALWLEGWDPSHVDAPRWEQTDPRADRLRLARVLRMLLREGASVRNREGIIGVLDAQASQDRRHPFATLDTLREVRRALGPEALGAGPAAVVVPMPEEHEQRIVAGLDQDRPAWTMSRAEAHRLVRDLRDWLSAQQPRPDTVVVDDPRVRPFAWRLLAAEEPALRVLSREELS
jgi:tetratricopeptide (TPR) repeat protein